MSDKFPRLLSSLCAFAAGSVLSASAFAGIQSQAQLADFAQKTEFTFDVVSNFASGNGTLDARILLENRSGVSLDPGVSDWEIYFHFVAIHSINPCSTPFLISMICC